MKRSAVESANPIPMTRKLRSATERRRQEEAHEEREARAFQAKSERAKQQTPFEQVLGLVILQGYLYKHECLKVASTSRGSFDVWKDVEDKLPEENLVEITVSVDRTKPHSVPFWYERDGKMGIVKTPEFVRNAFDTINALNVRAKKTPNERNKAQAKLLRWGIDILHARVYVWAPNNHNSGGLAIDLGKKRGYQYGLWKCRIEPDFIIWTGLTPRAEQRYNYLPIWPMQQNIEYFIYERDNDGE